MVAEIIHLPPSDPNAAGPFRYAEADRLLTLLDRAGYGEINMSDWRGRLPLGGAVPVTAAADFAVRRYLEEGTKIAREITARYAN